MSEDGFHPRPSWDGTPTDRDRDRDRDSDVGHGHALNGNGNSNGNGNGNGNGSGNGAGSTNGRMPHYAPSSESLHQQHHPTLQLFDEHSHGHTHTHTHAPPTPTKKSTSPHRRSSVESATRPSFASGSGSGTRWADGIGAAGPMAGIGAGVGAGAGAGAGGMAMAMGAQSELGHGYAPPRMSLESEVDGMGDDGEPGPASATDMATLVEPSFDENILRALCETDVSDLFLSGLLGRVRLGVVFADFMLGWGSLGRAVRVRDTQCGVPLLLDRIKQSIASCKVSGRFLCPASRCAPKWTWLLRACMMPYRKLQHS